MALIRVFTAASREMRCMSRSLFGFQGRTFSLTPFQKGSKDAEVSGSHSKKDKMYELRTYTIKPSDFKMYKTLTEDNFHLRTRHSKLIGFWSTELGGLNEVVHIWEYDNYDHRTKVRQELAKDSEWQNSYVAKVSPMWLKQNNETMMLSPWSTITSPSTKGVYELQMFNMNSHTDIWDGRLKAAMELSSEKLKDYNSILIAVFTTVFGQHNTVYTLWQHESYDQFSFGSLELMSAANKSVVHAFYHEVLASYSKGLKPLKVSPLQ